jgi:hypothetical protein
LCDNRVYYSLYAGSILYLQGELSSWATYILDWAESHSIWRPNRVIGGRLSVLEDVEAYASHLVPAGSLEKFTTTLQHSRVLILPTVLQIWIANVTQVNT